MPQSQDSVFLEYLQAQGSYSQPLQPGSPAQQQCSPRQPTHSSPRINRQNSSTQEHDAASTTAALRALVAAHRAHAQRQGMLQVRGLSSDLFMMPPGIAAPRLCPEQCCCGVWMPCHRILNSNNVADTAIVCFNLLLYVCTDPATPQRFAHAATLVSFCAKEDLDSTDPRHPIAIVYMEHYPLPVAGTRTPLYKCMQVHQDRLALRHLSDRGLMASRLEQVRRSSPRKCK